MIGVGLLAVLRNAEAISGISGGTVPASLMAFFRSQPQNALRARWDLQKRAGQNPPVRRRHLIIYRSLSSRDQTPTSSDVAGGA